MKAAYQNLAQANAEIDRLRAKCQRLTKALAGQSKVAYQRGYQQGVSDAVDEG